MIREPLFVKAHLERIREPVFVKVQFDEKYNVNNSTRPKTGAGHS